MTQYVAFLRAVNVGGTGGPRQAKRGQESSDEAAIKQQQSSKPITRRNTFAARRPLRDIPSS